MNDFNLFKNEDENKSEKQQPTLSPITNELFQKYLLKDATVKPNEKANNYETRSTLGNYSEPIGYYNFYNQDDDDEKNDLDIEEEKRYRILNQLFVLEDMVACIFNLKEIDAC